MSLLTTLTRMWLTRSARPFSFTGGYDGSLPYDGCEKLGQKSQIDRQKGMCTYSPSFSQPS